MRIRMSRQGIALFWITSVSVMLTLVSTVDQALRLNLQYRVVPYGLLWILINPFYWDQVLYRLWILAFELGSLLVLWKLCRMGRLSFNWVFASQVQNTIWAMLHWQESVTVTALAPLAAVNPIFALFAILQRLPFYGSPGWQCAYGSWPTPNCYLVDAVGTHHSRFSDPVHLFVYGMLVFWMLAPALAWYAKRLRFCSWKCGLCWKRLLSLGRLGK